ncbi:MAG: hypothetical protein ACP5E5_14190 [Acidobacteriaceae bacterium]
MLLSGNVPRLALNREFFNGEFVAASILLSSGPDLLGSGVGSASLDQIREAITAFFAMIAVNPVEFKYKIAPLREIGSHWNVDTQGARLVFQP